jgi:hypothetical protein
MMRNSIRNRGGIGVTLFVVIASIQPRLAEA